MVSEHRFAFIVLKSVFALVLYRFQRQIYTRIRIQKGREENIAKAEQFLKKETKINADVGTVPGHRGPGWEKLRFPLMRNVPYMGC